MTVDDMQSISHLIASVESERAKAKCCDDLTNTFSLNRY